MTGTRKVARWISGWRGAGGAMRHLTDARRANQRVGCPVPFAKIFPFPLHPNHFCIPAVPAHRGAFRDRHGRWARDAVPLRDRWRSEEIIVKEQPKLIDRFFKTTKALLAH